MLRDPAVVVLVALGACKPPIDLNEAPKIQIVSPTTDQRVLESTGVTAEVTLLDEDGDAPLTVVLSDDVDGELLRREDVSASETLEQLLTDLTPGLHELTVTADDGQPGGLRTASVRFQVDGIPSAPVITLGPADPTPSVDLVAELTTAAIDPEGTVVAYEWAWKDGDDVAVSGTTFPATLPSTFTEAGQTWTFTVTAREVTDDIAQSVTVTDTLTVSNAAPTAPTTLTLGPDAPSPFAPLVCEASGATDPEGADLAYVYTWSVDRGSGFVVEPSVTGGTLPVDLTRPGDLWRCEAGADDGAQVGPTLSDEVAVLPDGAPVTDATWILTGDVTGDAVGASLVVTEANAAPGPDRVLVGVPGLDQVAQFPVTALGLPTLPVLGAAPNTLEADDNGGGLLPGLGRRARSVGDLTNDGVGDVCLVSDDDAVLVVRSTDLPQSSAPGTTDLWPLAARLLPAAGTGFGVAVADGDADGDGLVEIAVSQQPTSGRHQVHVFEGAGLTLGASHTASGSSVATFRSAYVDEPGDAFGASLALGDFTGEGTPDLLIGAPRADALNDTVGAILFSGGLVDDYATYDEGEVSISFEHRAGRGFGTAVAMYPDVDANGSDDAVISAPGFATDKGRVVFFFGGVTPPDTLALADFEQGLTIEGLDQGGRFGEAMQIVGDLDGDGLPELAVSAPEAEASAGRVYVFTGATLAAEAATATPGNPVDLDTTDAAWFVTGELPGDRIRPLPGGDVDGDGLADLVIGSSTAGALDAGAVWVWLSSR